MGDHDYWRSGDNGIDFVEICGKEIFVQGVRDKLRIIRLERRTNKKFKFGRIKPTQKQINESDKSALDCGRLKLRPSEDRCKKKKEKKS